MGPPVPRGGSVKDRQGRVGAGPGQDGQGPTG